jgi:methyl-accepting chemotaxis protein
MRLNQLRIGMRLSLAFFVLLLLGACIAGLGWWRLQQAHHDITSARLADKAASDALLWESLTRLNVARALVLSRSGAGQIVLAEFGPQIEATAAQIAKLQKSLQAGTEQVQGQALLTELAGLRSTYLQAHDQAFELLYDKKPGLDQALDHDLLPAASNYLEKIAALRSYQQRRADQQQLQTQTSLEQAQTGLVALSALATVLGVLGAWLITRSVTAPLQRAVLATELIAHGDLSQTLNVQGRDEAAHLMRSLARMQLSLRQVVAGVRGSSDLICVASAEVADGSLDLSNRSETAAANLQETASSIEQITAAAEQNAGSALRATVLADQARAAADGGSHVVADVVKQMAQISDRSERISDITRLIDDIAFQTNLLALNAAVEAARAHTHGRGFAVVAGEVRMLAKRTAGAAQEIKTLVEANLQTVSHGAQLASQARQQMQEISGSIHRVVNIVGQISIASTEQSSSVSQVSQSVAQLDRMTQQNAALVEESAAAASSLRDQARHLVGVVAAFRMPHGPPVLA